MVVDWKEVSVFCFVFSYFRVFVFWVFASCARRSSLFVVRCCHTDDESDTHIHLSHFLNRIMPVISLGDTCSQISAAKSNLLVLTVGGQLYAW